MKAVGREHQGDFPYLRGNRGALPGGRAGHCVYRKPHSYWL